jgi:2',3'-cyclic-nucleotide 2'-phosphodiesterase (5'-nucleotidase family)
MLSTFLRRRSARFVAVSRRTPRCFASARSNTLTLVAVNDVYDLEHLPKLRTLVDAVKAEREGKVITTLAGDFLSPSVLSSLDRGRGMVQVLNAVGVDYACLGNHEADEATLINSNVPGAVDGAPATAVVSLPGGKRVGLLGLLTSEPGVFRKDVFRGLAIEDVLATAKRLSAELRADGAAAVVALTHQSIDADLELSRAGCVDLVVGGHEHEPFLEGETCRVVKTGQDAVRAAIIDLDVSGATVVTSVKFEDVTGLEPHAGAAAAAAEQRAFLTSLDNEKILSCASSEVLSSEKTRFRQTTVGRLLCGAVRDWFGCDAAMINGGTIKGGTTYATPALSLLDLRRELPFPTKMIVTDMPGSVLRDAIAHSRKGEPDDERRAFLQVCDAVDVDDRDRVISVRGEPLDPEKLYHVALPRNLCKGLFNIKPLVTWAEATDLPAEDDFVPAMNCVLLRHSYALWRRLGEFDDIDTNHDGVITVDEVRDAITRRRGGVEPPKILLDNVMEALDADHSGTINRDEFAHRVDH